MLTERALSQIELITRYWCSVKVFAQILERQMVQFLDPPPPKNAYVFNSVKIISPLVADPELAAGRGED